MALRIPTNLERAKEWAKELTDEMMSTAEERGGTYEKAATYYYTGSMDERAAIHNKTRTFIDRVAGYYYQPNGVRFNVLWDSNEPVDVLERGRATSQMLTADYRSTDTDLRFSDCVTWALISGCYFLKHMGDGFGFSATPVHPVNMGVLSESVVTLDQQEAFVHVSYPTVTRLRSTLEQSGHPRAKEIIARVMEARSSEREDAENTYFHTMVVGGMNPLGQVNSTPQAGGIVQVFPIPTPWRPNRRLSPTVKHCELWVKDAKRSGDYTTIQMIYPDIILEGIDTPKNLSVVPGHHPFVKVEANLTNG